MAQNLPHLPDWEQVSTNIIRVMGGNPSKFTLQGTNTYLLGSGPSRILIDTGTGEKKWIDTLRSVLTSTTTISSSTPLTISTCILTHWHHDHIGGVKDLEALNADLSANNNLKVYKNQPTYNPDGILEDPASRVLDIRDGQRFSIPLDREGEILEIQAIHTPGHAKDHMVFQITSSPDPAEVGALFTADNVLGHGTAVFEDLALYLDSLALMRQRVVDAVAAQQQKQNGGDGGGGGDVKRAYPGHGQYITDAAAKIDEYIAHRRMREDEALNVLRFGSVKSPGHPIVHDSITREGGGADASDSESQATTTANKKKNKREWWTSLDMVKVIYRHYPENLWEPAERGLVMVLEKLRRDGKVVCEDAGVVGEEAKAKLVWRASGKATL